MLFLDQLERVVRRFGIEVHAFALMPNHFHLLVRSVHGNLSRAMQGLLGPYTQELNSKYRWDGPVFKGRFRSQLVVESEHLQVLVPYIHLNPVEANIVQNPMDALWNSFSMYAGLTPPSGWLSTGTVLAMYGSAEALVDETMAYRRKEIEWPTDFNPDRGMFVLRPVEERAAQAQATSWRVEQKEHVRRVLEVVTEAPWASVQAVRWGRGGNPARLLAIYLFSQYTELTYREIAEELNVSKGQISVVIHRMRRGKVGQELAHWLRRARLWLDTGSDPEQSNS